MDIDKLPDGIYYAKLRSDSGYYRVEKKDGHWFFSDGTGWTLDMENPKDSIESIQALGKKTVKTDTLYKNNYPLTDFFPKE